MSNEQFNYFKKVNKPTSRVFKEFMKVLQELDAVSSKTVDADQAVNGKRSVLDLTENTKKETGMHILIFYENLTLSFDLNIVLGVKNPKYFCC